jgi:hypothetical protein
MQCEVRCFCNDGAGKDCLELWSVLEPLHERQASVQRNCGWPAKTGLYSQALAAFGAACSNHCAAATRFHAREEAVRTGAFDFGRLVCAFHD